MLLIKHFLNEGNKHFGGVSQQLTLNNFVSMLNASGVNYSQIKSKDLLKQVRISDTGMKPIYHNIMQQFSFCGNVGVAK